MIERTPLTKEIKKEQWGEGPWVHEEDSYFFEYKGLKCAVVRQWAWEGFSLENLSLGHLCGYVQLPIDHPWANISPFDIDPDVHGGVNFNGYILPEEKEGDSPWIGFDCGHMNDIVPSVKKFMKENKIGEYLEELMKLIEDQHPLLCKTYKDMNFVSEEVKKLADQVLENQ